MIDISNLKIRPENISDSTWNHWLIQIEKFENMVSKVPNPDFWIKYKIEDYNNLKYVKDIQTIYNVVKHPSEIVLQTLNEYEADRLVLMKDEWPYPRYRKETIFLKKLEKDIIANW